MTGITRLTGTAERSYEVVKGTSVTINGSVKDDNDDPVDITGATIVVRWKTNRDDDDGDAVATASGTVDDGPNGLYSFTNPTGSSDTAGPLHYHVEITTTGGEVYYPQAGGWLVVHR